MALQPPAAACESPELAVPRLSLSTSQRGQDSPSGTVAVLYVQPGWGGNHLGGRGCHLGAVAPGHPRGDRTSLSLQMTPRQRAAAGMAPPP